MSDYIYSVIAFCAEEPFGSALNYLVCYNNNFYIYLKLNMVHIDTPTTLIRSNTVTIPSLTYQRHIHPHSRQRYQGMKTESVRDQRSVDSISAKMRFRYK